MRKSFHFIDFRKSGTGQKRERDRERERQKHWCEKETLWAASCMGYNRDGSNKLEICPDSELNLRSFGAWVYAPTTLPHRPQCKMYLFYCTIPFICNFPNRWVHRDRNQTSVFQRLGRGNGKFLFHENEAPFWSDERFCK